MDFEALLHFAKKNEAIKKEPVKCLQTKFKPPTKQQRDKDKVLSEGVQKFLARKEEEENRKKLDAEKRREELNALRAKDPKANKRVQTMLKRTKSANKSVMEDAIDNNNTADTLAGPSQPDEDDYGFVSESSSALYNKLIEKMYSTPSDDQPSFAPKKKPSAVNLLSTKERVKMALLKEKEEEMLPHKRKRKHKEGKSEIGEKNPELDYTAPDRDYQTEKSDREKEKEKGKVKEEKPKFKRPPKPPPLDFHALLKLAEKKQHEPVVVEPKLNKSDEPEMLMTKKQRLEHEKMQEYRRRRWERENGIRNENSEEKSVPRIPKIGLPEQKTTPVTSLRIPKLNRNESEHEGRSDKRNLEKNKPSLQVRDVRGERPTESKPKPVERLLDKDRTEEKERQKSVVDKRALDRSQIKERNIDREKVVPSRDKKYKDVGELDPELEQLKRERDNAKKLLEEKERLIRERDEFEKRIREKEQLIRERDEAMRKLKMYEERDKELASKKDKQSKVPVKNDISKISKTDTSQRLSDEQKKKLLVKSQEKIKTAPSVKEFPPKDLQPKNGVREFPPKDLQQKNGVREFPPKDLQKKVPPNRPSGSKDLQRSKQFPPGDVRRKAPPTKKRRIEDSDEYDSDLADFIDDGPEEDLGREDVSKMISEIFRYDRNKYSRYDDDDDECMESNFSQISKEEFISAKYGLMEDLEDMQREKAETERKKSKTKFKPR